MCECEPSSDTPVLHLKASFDPFSLSLFNTEVVVRRVCGLERWFLP